MHEASIARQLVAAVLARLPAGHRAIRVVGWLGETETLAADSLALHFAHHAHGTPAEGAALELSLIHVRARCDACGAVYRPEHHLTLCPSCGHTEAALLDRTGLGIDQLVIGPMGTP